MSDLSKEIWDVVLVGAGPIGLELAVGLQQAGTRYLHLEAAQVGHTISWFPLQARFFSSPERIAICGVPLLTVDQSKASREEYLTYLLGIVQQFQLRIQTYERVVELKPESGPDGARFLICTERAAGAARYRARNVVIAIGDMHRPRELTYDNRQAVPGVDLPHVASYFHEPHQYAGQRLLIVGGKNSAIEAALRCFRVGAQITLCQRQADLSTSIKYWLRPEIESLIKTGAIRFMPSSAPVRIGRTEVVVAPVDEQLAPILDPPQWKSVPADFVLLLIGYQMDPVLLEQAGVHLHGPGRTPEFDPQTMRTNVPGVYVAGTSAAGTQLNFKLFIENCHAHVVRILRDLTGHEPRHINPLAYSSPVELNLPSES